MALHLVKIATDGNAKEGDRPRSWKAEYLVTSRSPARVGKEAKCFWFDLTIERTPYADPESRYDLKFAVDFRMPSFRAALGRLACWARQLAIGIEECGDLPDDSIPLLVESSSKERDGFGFRTEQEALAYARLYSPALRVEETYYQADGSPGGFGEYTTYFFVEIPQGEPAIIPAWGIPYSAPVYRRKLGTAPDAP